jgi:WD40 repeat protein
MAIYVTIVTRRGAMKRVCLTVAATCAGVAAVFGLSILVDGAHARAAAPVGEIVFASDRVSDNPGELYQLTPGGRPRDLTRTPTVPEAFMAVAPSGGAIAFWSLRGGHWQPYLAREDGTHVRLAGPARPQGPMGEGFVFSGDGRLLLVDTVHPFVVDVASGATHRVVGPCGYGWTYAPHGRTLACVDARLRRTDVLDARGRALFSLPGTYPLWSPAGLLASTTFTPSPTAVLVDAEGRRIAHLAGRAAAWSPDGRLLALSRAGALVVFDAVQRRVVRTIRGPHSWTAYWVAFPPDGRGVAYDGPSGPRLAPLSPTPEQVLPARGGVWSSDGRYAFLRFTGRADDHVFVEVGDRLGRGARLAGSFDYDDHGGSQLAWTADGRLLYLWGERARYDLWAVRADGSDLRRLTFSHQSVMWPAATSDGMRLAYAAAPYEGGLCGYCDTSVSVADADGRNAVVVPGSVDGQSSGDSRPSFSPDGTRLVVSTGFSGEVDTVNVDGSDRTPFATDSIQAAWSPTGAWIAYAAHGQIVLATPAGADAHAIARVTDSAGLAWSPDGRSLAYGTSSGIFVVPADGSAAPARLVAGPASDPSYAPDGSAIVFAAGVGHGLLAQSDLEVVSVDGSGLHRIAASPFDDGEPVWRSVAP